MKPPSLSVFAGKDNSSGKISGNRYSVSWKSPSNIAFVKYWGKKENQVPMNPSLSMTLTGSFSITRVDAVADGGKKMLTVNGFAGHPFILKMDHFLQHIRTEMPVLKELSFKVETTNSFPHSTGIASSASGFSAFALCILSVAELISGKKIAAAKFIKLASFISRIGSGSACRSLYGGYSLWGKTDHVQGSSNLYAIPVDEWIHPSLRTLHDAVLVISSDPKSLPSSLGHSLMAHHPFAPARIGQAEKNLAKALNALKSGDIKQLTTIAENEAMTLHALILSSEGGTVLLRPPTIEVILRIKEARGKGLPVFFSLDAGPNVHLFYPAESAKKVEKFIREELVSSCENGLVIFDRCGTGPEKQEI
jgi:diphosphomevalonate decarboxylase